MEFWKTNIVDGIENAQHFQESKEITSFQAVKEFFKNVFFNFIDEVDSSKASITEKKHEIQFYIGDLSMAVIDKGSNMIIWRLDSKESKVIAMVDTEAGYSLVRYVNPVKVAYLCEDEIEDIFEQTFHRLAVIH